VAIVSCESDFDQMAHNACCHSFFQDMLSTWHAHGGRGDPHNYPIEEQARVNWRVLQESGEGQWECKA
jgi:hypothetical protein